VGRAKPAPPKILTEILLPKNEREGYSLHAQVVALAASLISTGLIAAVCQDESWGKTIVSQEVVEVESSIFSL
jgi:hypothetical protein